MGQMQTGQLWLDKTYDDTMTLLIEAKHYHVNRFNQQTLHLTPIMRLALTRESLRITTRLSETMAWLLNEKAILNDEINRQLYHNQNNPLNTHIICTQPDHALEDLCPQGLQDLLDRSLALFRWVAHSPSWRS